MIGKKYSKLTVLSKCGIHEFPSGEKVSKWLCRCECGKETIVLRPNLRNKTTKSCGCLIIEKCRTNKRNIDLTGKRFNRLTVIKKEIKDNKKLWLCKCQCGQELFVSTGRLRSSNTQSCGCLNIDKIKQRNQDPTLISKRLTKGIKTFITYNWKTGKIQHCKGSYEKTVVDFLNRHKILYEWQIPFSLSNSTVYICDLKLIDSDILVEIKGRWYEDAKQKFQEFQALFPNKSIEVWDKYYIEQIKTW